MFTSRTQPELKPLPGEYGTLSEISFALINSTPVYGFDTWDIKGVIPLQDPEELREYIPLSG